MADKDSDIASPPHSTSEPPRRPFLYRLLTIVVGAFVGLVPLLSGVAVFFDPLRRRTQGESQDEGNWIRVATIDTVPDDGVPRQFPVISDLIDAWNRTPNQPIGAVYLRRPPGEDEIQCFNAICPHAGCFVAVVDSPDGKRFGCPCHTSGFSPEGEALYGPSPRDMDPLDVDSQRLAETGEIWVDFKNFIPGHEERKVKA